MNVLQFNLGWHQECVRGTCCSQSSSESAAKRSPRAAAVTARRTPLARRRQLFLMFRGCPGIHSTSALFASKLSSTAWTHMARAAGNTTLCLVLSLKQLCPGSGLGIPHGLGQHSGSVWDPSRAVQTGSRPHRSAHEDFHPLVCRQHPHGYRDVSHGDGKPRSASGGHRNLSGPCVTVQINIIQDAKHRFHGAVLSRPYVGGPFDVFVATGQKVIQLQVWIPQAPRRVVPNRSWSCLFCLRKITEVRL